MTKKKLLEKLGEAYGDGWPMNRDEALDNGNGDGLAAFIYLELDEVLSDKKVDLVDAERLMSRAKDQLEDIIFKIEELAQ